MLDKANKEFEEKKEWMINVLPDPFKEEFEVDVLIDLKNMDMKTLNKVFTYYITEIQTELPKEVLEKISEKYLFIEL